MIQCFAENFLARIGPYTLMSHTKMSIVFGRGRSTNTLDARGLLAHQRQGTLEYKVVLIGERPLGQAVKSFERADPITLPFISPESKFDPVNLIGRLKKRFSKRLLLVKCTTILSEPVLTINLTKLPWVLESSET